MSKRIFSILLFFITAVSFGQLPGFTFTVTPVDQTCTGNGALNFTVSGTQPGASMEYAVYLLPDTTTPILITTGTSAANLVAGDYLVIATQSVGGESGSESETVTISDNAVQLAYQFLPEHVRCGTDGEIMVNVTAGNAVSYEILSGPVTVSPQASNVFTGLPVGQYEVRVYDTCNDALVVTVQLVQIPTDIFIEGPGFDPILPSCDTVIINYGIMEPSPFEVFYPVTFEYTVYPPGGGEPYVVSSLTGNAEIPFYNWEFFTYDLKITDACGNVFEWNDLGTMIGTDVDLDPVSESCGNFFLNMEATYYYPPYTIEFISAPDGFDPEEFNLSHPVFSVDEINYGSDENPVPLGNYEVQIIDACGHSYIRTLEIIDEAEAQIEGTPVAVTCLGQMGIIIDGRDIDTVVMVEAPDDYGPVPDNVSEFVDDNGDFYMNMLPHGEYIFSVTDQCGIVYVLSDIITPSAADLLLYNDQRPGCDIGMGSLQLYASQNPLTSVIITEAPTAFAQPLPYDASSLIDDSSGNFFMNSLPEGDYTFETIDNCGTIRTTTLFIEGYAVSESNIEILANCGSFDLYLEYISNGNAIQSFWLEKFNEDEGHWEHPVTGVNDMDNVPGIQDAAFLNNNQININVGSVGQFRILKMFYTWDNGSGTQIRCIEEISNFTFDGAPVINGAYSFSCTEGTAEVIIDAEAIPPLTYEITEMNGEPFSVDNGTSEVFTGLAEGTYNFRVTDDCGSFANILFDITVLDPLNITADGFCDGQDSVLQVQAFSFLTYEWWKDSPDEILGTANILAIPEFDPATDAGVYYVHIMSDNPGSCIDQILEYEVIPTPHPQAGSDTVSTVCNQGQVINLQEYLVGSFDGNGTWSDNDAAGGLNGSQLSLEDVEPGTYVFSYTVINECGIADDAEIALQIKALPPSPQIELLAPVCEGEDIQLTAGAVQGAAYHWEGPGGFISEEESPLIEDVGIIANGSYTVTITLDGCTSEPATIAVMVNSLPQFTIEGTMVLCTGQVGVLSVAPSNFEIGEATYQWYYNGALLEDIDSSITILEPGIYGVTVNADGCSTHSDLNVTLNDTAFEVVAAGGCINEHYMLYIADSDVHEMSTITWEGPNGFVSAEQEVDISGATSGEYTVTITNDEGCIWVDSVVVENTNCIIPRGISPNNDGNNDSFDLSHLDVKSLKIFNRYGLTVYEAEGYTKEWHGQSGKGELPTATYFYMITLSEGKQVTGWVYLQREE